MSKQPWDSSSHSMSSLQDLDRSWQGLGSADASATSDCSFNPLTYKLDVVDDAHLDPEGASESRRESVCTLVGGEVEEDMTDVNSLTGMLRFVNQTLAMQEDPSLWSSAPSQQVRATPLFPRS